MKYDELLRTLQNLTNREIRKIDIVNALGWKFQKLANRANRNSDFSTEEIRQINEHFNVDLFHKTSNINTRIDNDFKEVPIYGNVHASMGHGITVYDESQTATYQISNKLAQDLGVNVSNCKMIFASGDSMLPTIEGGDSLLVDHSKRDVYDGKIYCVRIDGQLYAKRLQKIPPYTIVVISDNPKYKSFEIDFSKQIDFDFEIIGEVKWWGRVAK